MGDGELCKDRRRKEGSERAGRSGRKVERLAERGRRTEQGGGAGRILEVCAGERGSVPGREASESRVDLEPRKKREWQKET